MSIIKKGIDEAMRSSARAGKFLTLQADVPVDVVLMHGLDDVQSVDQHDLWDFNPAPHLVCLGDECPCCELGYEAKVKSYIGVLTREQETKYLPAGASILGQLQRAEKAVGNLTGRLVRFEKTGVGLKTRYTATMLGKKMDVSKFELPDLEDLLGPLDLETQLKTLEEAGIDVSDARGALTTTKSTAKKAPAKKAKSAPAPAEEKKPETTPVEDDGSAPWDDAEEEVESIDGWASL